MKTYEKLLLENKAWAKEKVEDDPDYFNRLAELQTPDFLWIGCSDSRVPANEITNTQPGEIFVHRNVANLVLSTDVNLLSVVDYAVNYLKVKHIIVCGHYGCGGVTAALSDTDYGNILNMWLRNIKDVIHMYANELNAIENKTEKVNRLVELNVIEQVKHLAHTTIIQHAWKSEQRPQLHGWVYGLKDGKINSIFEMAAGSEVDDVYKFNL